MSILTLFVAIPLLMLAGLWLAKNDGQVRGVMVVGATALLALAAWLTVYFVQQRSAGNSADMLLTYSVTWFAPLHIAYSVGVDGISVVMILLSAIIVFHRNVCKLAASAHEEGVFPLVRATFVGCVRLLHFHRHVHHVHVL